VAPDGDASRVLVVDDESDLAATYVRLIGRHGYEVIAVGTRREALAVVEREALTLVIADLRLPDGSGLDVIRAAAAPARGVAAIVVTGFSCEATRRAAREAGATAYFAKPFSAPRLLETVKELAGAARCSSSR
jgi:DNA-binding response OmpR family regulator